MAYGTSVLVESSFQVLFPSRTSQHSSSLPYGSHQFISNRAQHTTPSYVTPAIISISATAYCRSTRHGLPLQPRKIAEWHCWRYLRVHRSPKKSARAEVEVDRRSSEPLNGGWARWLEGFGSARRQPRPRQEPEIRSASISVELVDSEFDGGSGCTAIHRSVSSKRDGDAG